MTIYNLEYYINKAKSHPRHKDKNYGYERSIFIDRSTPMEIFCLTHQIYFWQRPDAHINGRGCKECRKEYQTKNKQQKGQKNFERKSRLVPNHQGKNYGYEEIMYIDVYTPIKIYCPTCKEYFWQRPNDHLNGKGCQTCGHNRQQAESDRRKKLARDTFIEKANIKHGIGRYGYIKIEYNKSNEKVCIICNKCELEFRQTPNSHLAGQGCPYCRESYGEKEIRKYLLENNINFDRQFKFDDCRNILPLSFDFVIFDKEDNTKVKFLIEFQGKQHYEPIEKWGGIDNLVQIQIRDAIKLSYATNNNIPLLIIPYNQLKNIPTLITSFLNKYYYETITRI